MQFRLTESRQLVLCTRKLFERLKLTADCRRRRRAHTLERGELVLESGTQVSLALTWLVNFDVAANITGNISATVCYRATVHATQ